MSRFSLDDDEPYDDTPRPDARCTDCGVDYAKAEADPTTTCDACSDQRDAHTSALEIRLMATAVLAADMTRLKDIA